MARGEAGSFDPPWGLGSGVIIVGSRLRIIIGAGVAALLGWALHGPLGQGEAFIADLRLRSITALAGHGLGDVQVSYPAAPRARTARLAGSAAPAQRAEALAVVSSVDGNGGARWHETAVDETAGDEKAVSGAGLARAAAVPDAPVAGTSVASGDRRLALSSAAPGDLPRRDVSAAAPLSAAACQQAIDTALGGEALRFQNGSAWLSPASQRLIARVAAALRTCGGQRLEVGGHGNGDALANRAMAAERARRVRAALVEAGAPADAVTARGYGADRPLDAARPGDAANRRVSFTIMAGGA